MMRTIMAVIGVVLAAAIFYFYTDPTYAQIQTDQAQIAQYNEALNKAAQLESLKQSLLTKYNSFDPTDIARLQTMLPDQVNDIALILDFDTLAGQYGMSLQNVDVSSDDDSTTQTDGVTSGAVGDTNLPYNTLTMKFAVTGSYATFLQFLTALQSSLAIVDIQSLTVSQNPQDAGVNGGPVYTFNVTLQTYWLKPSTSLAPSTSDDTEATTTS
jgi:Tfp pilus assembly protein PilO